jgi:hypothetical protein
MKAGTSGTRFRQRSRECAGTSLRLFRTTDYSPEPSSNQKLLTFELAAFYGTGTVAKYRQHRLVLLLFTAFLCVNSGCVSPGYHYGNQQYTSHDAQLVPDEPQFERGTPHEIVDGIGWVVGIPPRILLWDARVESHFVSPDTEAALRDYLAANELDCVKVRLNQYAPLEDWKRLRRNKSVGAGWRYTLGTVSILGEAILPGRLIGGDHYNPFSNTVHLYSDHPAIALHEAGHARDFAQRQYKGTWAAAYTIPGLALIHEARATNDALSYLAAEGKTDELREAYEILYPAYGTHVAGQINQFVPPPADLAVTAACTIPGHLLGRWQSSRVDTEP